MQYEKNGNGTKVTFKILELIITLGVILGSIVIWSATQAGMIGRNTDDIRDVQQDIEEINMTLNNENYGLKILNLKIENLPKQINR
ncbi:MAG TPA: hypothetical protein VF985_04250 [Mariniflexile sp.]